MEVGGRDRDRTCGLIHAMDALSQLSYTPVIEQINRLMVWQTAIILTNNPMEFHCEGMPGVTWNPRKLIFSVPPVFFFVSSVLFPRFAFPPAKQKLPLEWQPYA